MSKYEMGVLMEYGDKEAIVSVNQKEHRVILSDDEAKLLETLLMEEDIDYVAFDTENKQIVFDDVFDMTELDDETLSDIKEGVNDDGIAE